MEDLVCAMDRAMSRFEFLTTAQDPAAIVGRFDPLVGQWWQGRFAQLTAPQALAIPAIQERRHVLVCAPTGSGKTLTAFITVLSDLFARQQAGTLETSISCVYVSPLRALGTDIARNLSVPLQEIAGTEELPIRVEQRTGDTTSSQRTRMARKPPHILVTTPESLALCLAQPSMRQHLLGVRTIIIDELHSLASNKRGVDLALTIERLATLVRGNGQPEPQRIGLSATIAPLETMAEYLVGPQRPCAIADASFDRPLDLQIQLPFNKTPFAKSATITRNVYDMLEAIVREHRTTLVFTNLRAATERVAYNLRKRFAGDPEQIQAHHSSLDREVRLSIEQRLKDGQLKCVVCSTSLELGIDIGSIDRVVLLNSPKGISRGLQRIGRSGHSHGGTASGIFMPMWPADMVESIVTAQMMRCRKLDAITPPRNCLDVLAQHLIGMGVQAGAEGFEAGAAYELVRRTYCYATLSREDFEACVGYVAGPSPRSTATNNVAVAPGEAPAGAKAGRLEVDADGRLRLSRPGSAGLYYQNVGTIASEASVFVRLRNGPSLGTVEEGFAASLKPGDRFVLGGRCVAFVGIERMTVTVAASDGQMPTVPRWFGGMMAMAEGLAREMREFRAKVRTIAPAGIGAIVRMLMRQWNVGPDVADLAAQYLHAQFRYADIPVDDWLLVERVPDEGAVALVFHTMIGRAGNEALARLLAYRLHKFAGGNASVVVDDYAFGVWVPAKSAARRADRTLLRDMLSPENFDADVRAAIETSELFRTHFRHTAVRAHAITQNHFGSRRFVGSLQSSSTRLHEVLREQHPDHLLLRETRRTILEDILSAPAARAFLERQQGRAIRLLDLATPSPFAFGLFATSRRDTMQLADTSDFLLTMYAQVQKRMAEEAKDTEETGMLGNW
jgi:ATP-dependent helicase Lhr and Lhr-like helicase